MWKTKKQKKIKDFLKYLVTDTSQRGILLFVLLGLIFGTWRLQVLSVLIFITNLITEWSLSLWEPDDKLDDFEDDN